MGCRRFAIASSVIAFGSAAGRLTTSCTSRIMATIGTTNESTITTINCRGVLMKDDFGSCSLTASACLELDKGMILHGTLAGHLRHPVHRPRSGVALDR